MRRREFISRFVLHVLPNGFIASATTARSPALAKINITRAKELMDLPRDSTATQKRSPLVTD
jgi:hypothetical protein